MVEAVIGYSISVYNAIGICSNFKALRFFRHEESILKGGGVREKNLDNANKNPKRQFQKS